MAHSQETAGGLGLEGSGSFRWMDKPDPSQHLLMRDLRRQGVKLYGTRWCLNCRQQKAMLYQLSDQNRWKDMYVDCDLLLNSLETAYIKQVPAWKVGSEYHLGMQSEETLRSLVDKVAGRKKDWKTGGAAQWQRRHRQRAGWAKQEYAVLVRDAIARGKAAAAADKATRRIPQVAEMHPPQPTPHRAALAPTAPGVTALRTATQQTGMRTGAEANTPSDTRADAQIVLRPSPTNPSSEIVNRIPPQINWLRPLSPGSLRDHLRLRSPSVRALHERIPIFGGLWQKRSIQERGQLAPVGWFRDRFTDADYGQLFEAVAKIRLLSLPQLLAVPRLLKPTFARASSAVETVSFGLARQASNNLLKEREEQAPRVVRMKREGGNTENLSWLRGGESFWGRDTPQDSGRVQHKEVGGESRKGGNADCHRRPWWRSIFSR